MDSKSIIGCFQLIPLFGRWNRKRKRKRQRGTFVIHPYPVAIYNLNSQVESAKRERKENGGRCSVGSETVCFIILSSFANSEALQLIRRLPEAYPALRPPPPSSFPLTVQSFLIFPISSSCSQHQTPHLPSPLGCFHGCCSLTCSCSNCLQILGNPV